MGRPCRRYVGQFMRGAMFVRQVSLSSACRAFRRDSLLDPAKVILSISTGLSSRWSILIAVR